MLAAGYDGAAASHLLQMRGLKQIGIAQTIMKEHVASFTDAWIETCIICRKRKANACRIFYRCVD